MPLVKPQALIHRSALLGELGMGIRPRCLQLVPARGLRYVAAPSPFFRQYQDERTLSLQVER